MTPLNERPTPETESEINYFNDTPRVNALIIELRKPCDGDRMDMISLARTLERSLTERTDERDKLIEMRSYCMGILREAGHDEAAPIEALVRSSIAYASRMESDRDTALTKLAKLAKCREALKQIAESGRGNTVWAETRPAQIARQTLDRAEE